MFSVHRLHYATVNLAGKYNPPSFEDTRIDVFGYLLQSEQMIVLVDTGVGVGNEYIDAQFHPIHTSIEKQLEQFELAPSAVDMVINTHLHFDHCGNNQLFHKAKIMVQQAELTAAKEKFYTLREWFDYEGANLVSVNGDEEITEGLKLLFTPGHTPGHQSVLVETDQGPVLIAAQAAFSAAEYSEGGNPEVQAHEGFGDRYFDSINRLKSIRADRVLFSHDTTELSG